ncbi:MAG: LPS-assembly protein LptD, partial [Flavobacterium sp.]
MRTNLFYIVLSAYFLTIGSCTLLAQETPKKSKSFPVKNQSVKSDTKSETTTKTEDITIKNKDTSATKTIKVKSVLEGKVKYKAKKYAKFDQKKKLITLYDEAELNYL